MDKSLTVIIPVFRTEKTMDKCLESVVSQEYGHLEIILVDDGSPDSCPLKCDEWAAKDKRIKVIHKSNGGLSDARNHALDISTGDYITFVDSDDYIAQGTYIRLMDVINAHPEYDILEYEVDKFPNTKYNEALTFSPCVFHDVSKYWLEEQAYKHTYVWNKIFKKELFCDTRFIKDVYFEDSHLMAEILPKTNCIATTGIGLYHYSWNPTGITANAGLKELSDLLNANIKLVNGFSHCFGFEKYYIYVLNLQLCTYALGGQILLPDLKIKALQRLGGKAFLKALILNIIGVKGICKIYRIFHRIKLANW